MPKIILPFLAFEDGKKDVHPPQKYQCWGLATICPVGMQGTNIVCPNEMKSAHPHGTKLRMLPILGHVPYFTPNGNGADVS